MTDNPHSWPPTPDVRFATGDDAAGIVQTATFGHAER